LFKLNKSLTGFEQGDFKNEVCVENLKNNLLPKTERKSKNATKSDTHSESQKEIKKEIKTETKRELKCSIPTNQFEKVIERLCADDILLNDTSFDKLENKINFLIKSKQTVQQIPSFSLAIAPQAVTNEENINVLMNQLNELENLLKNTKSELFSNDTMKGFNSINQNMNVINSSIMNNDYNDILQNISYLNNNTSVNNCNYNFNPNNMYNVNLNMSQFNNFNNLSNAYENNSCIYNDDANAFFVEHMFKF